VGCAFTAFVSYGNGNFMPSFLMRNHGMSLAEVGATLGLISGLSGAAGTFLGGYMADRLGVRDMRWYIWIPMLGGLSAMIPAYYTLLGENTTLIIAAMIPSQILGALYLGPCIATCHNLVSPGMRAMASAILYFVLNIIGLGLGPLTVGILSDLFADPFGVDNLRYAMAVTLTMSLLGALFLWMGVKGLKRDLAMNRQALSDGATST
jgi:MFS family permease